MSGNEVGSKEEREGPATGLVIFKQEMTNQNGLLFRGLKHQMGQMNSKGSSNVYLKTEFIILKHTEKSTER